MDAKDLKFSNADEVYEKLVQIAEKLGISYPELAVDRTINFIHHQMNTSFTIPPKVQEFRESLRNSASQQWMNEEKLLLIAHFILAFSLSVAVFRFRIYSRKNEDEVLLKLKVLATIYGIFILGQFFFLP